MINSSSLISKLFEPHESYIPEPAQRQLQAKRNQENFSVFLGYFLLYPFFIPLTHIVATTHIINMTGILFQALLYLLLCRSHIGIFVAQYTFMSTIAPIFFTPQSKELIIFHFGHAFIIPPLIFMISRKPFLTAIAGCAQVLLFHSTYKSVLLTFLEESKPDVFVDKFVGGITFTFIHLFTFCFFALRLLHNKTTDLSQAKTLVEETLDQQKTFILSFSHELRNPLNSLLGNLQLVLMGAISLESKEMIKTAKICGELLLQYINNLLDTGKCEIGNLEVSSSSTNVYDLFQRIWSISHEIIKRKGLIGHLKIERKVPLQLLLDSQRITQVFLNLIGNAVKFTDHGSITTTVQWLDYDSVCEECFEPIPYDETEEGLFEKEENVSMVSLSNQQRDLTSDYLLLNNKNNKFNFDEVVFPENGRPGILKMIIKDTGCGMKEEALKLLFQKFSQVSDDSSKRKIGTGLGLFITKEICKRMQGDIRVYSREKIGTTFIVCIPTLSVSVRRTWNQYSLDLISRSLSITCKKAIIADDSPFNVNLLCNYFSKIGVQVIATANNGQDAVKKYIECVEKKIIIDIITLDVDMPKINGKVACEKIREFEVDHVKPKTNIVMISGNYDESDLTEYLCSNRYLKANLFLKKPVLFEDFMVKIYELLTKN